MTESESKLKITLERSIKAAERYQADIERIKSPELRSLEARAKRSAGAYEKSIRKIEAAIAAGDCSHRNARQVKRDWSNGYGFWSVRYYTYCPTCDRYTSEGRNTWHDGRPPSQDRGDD